LTISSYLRLEGPKSGVAESPFQLAPNESTS
jgi:hypothetical protein